MEPTSIAGLLPAVCALARDAGKLIKHYYDDDSARVRYKADQSPVTDADLAANALIVKGLQALRPWPIVSEEAEHDSRRLSKTYWLVDPLDGTKEFIARSDEFTVNIALVHEHVSVLGVVLAPVSGALYYASQGFGSYLVDGATAPRRLTSRPFRREHFVLVASRRHAHANLEAFTQQWPGCQVRRVGSSLKFCLIAAGEADLYLRFGPTAEWDTAAGQCVLEEAGGQVSVFTGKASLQYGQKSDLINPDFIAAGDRQCQAAWFWPQPY